MDTHELPILPESQISTLSVQREGNHFRIASLYVDITWGKEPLKLVITVKKLPTSVEFGDSIQFITIDNKSPKLQWMRKEAAKLQSLPERARIVPLMALVRNNIHYAFPWVMEELKQTEPKRAKWVNNHTGLWSHPTTPLTLSQVVDGEYAICRHLSVVTLALAKDAGLKGAALVYKPLADEPGNKIKNVFRKDTGKNLFQSVRANEPFENHHSFVELLLSNGEWIPVDPTVQLTGETPEGLALFKEANYRANIGEFLEKEGLPEHTYGQATSSLQFLPGEDTRSGIYIVNGVKLLRPKAEPEYPRYQGPLDFTLAACQSYMGTNIDLLSVSPAG